MSTYDIFCDIFRTRLTSYLDDMDLENKHEIEMLINDLTQRWVTPSEKISIRLLDEMKRSIKTDNTPYAMAIELIKMAMRRDALMLERRVKKLTMIQKAIQNDEFDFESLGYSYNKY